MQKSSIVICINDTFLPEQVSMFDKLPVKGESYMVREIMPPYFGPNDIPGISLEEIKGKIAKHKCYDGIVRDIEWHFIIERFVEMLPPAELELVICDEKETLVLI